MTIRTLISTTILASIVVSAHAAENREFLNSFLPEKETPLVREGISLWNIVDADNPDEKKAKKAFHSANKRQPPLE